MRKYIKLWYLYSIYSTQVGLQSRLGAVLFLLGKFIRFGVFFFFIYIISNRVKDVAGYSFWQMIFVFATFNLVDTSSQLFLREVYRFRSYVVSGSLDYFLIRPIIPIFRFLFGGADILDVPLLIVSIIFVIFSFLKLNNPDTSNIIIYIVLIFNSLLIALSFHIFVLAIGILTAEVDNALWLYRDLTQMGRIPTDLYTKPIQGIITFAIPIGIMITFPAKALFGILSLKFIFLAFLVGILFLITSYSSWKYAIKRYSSASS